MRPAWTPDGQRIVFASDRDGGEALYWQPADGSGSAERLWKGEPGMRLQAESWTRDGKTLILVVNPGGGTGSILMMTPNADSKPTQLVSPAGNPNLSPDGKWLAYHAATGPGGRLDLFVEPFPPTGAKYQITTNGAGGDALWSPDGKKLFYLGPPRQLFAVDIQTQPRFTFGKPKPLPIQGLVGAGPRRYDITPDGKYFIVMLTASENRTDKPPQEQINVTLNWFSELQQRVPIK